MVIRGLTRQAKMAGLPLPYFMAVGALTVLPFMISKSLPWLLTGVIWYFGARTVTAINPHGHRLIVTRLRHLPRSFCRRVISFERSGKGRLKDV